MFKSDPRARGAVESLLLLRLESPLLLSHVSPAEAVDEILNVRSGEIVVQLSRLKFFQKNICFGDLGRPLAYKVSLFLRYMCTCSKVSNQ